MMSCSAPPTYVSEKIADFRFNQEEGLHCFGCGIGTAGDNSGGLVGVHRGKRKRNDAAVRMAHDIGLFDVHFIDEFGNVPCHQLVGNHPGVGALPVAAAVRHIDGVKVAEVLRNLLKPLVAAAVSVDENYGFFRTAVADIVHREIGKFNVGFLILRRKTFRPAAAIKPDAIVFF